MSADASPLPGVKMILLQELEHGGVYYWYGSSTSVSQSNGLSGVNSAIYRGISWAFSCGRRSVCRRVLRRGWG
jgi:hypothetical protein